MSPLASHLTLSFIPGKSMSDMELSLALAETGVCVVLGAETVTGRRSPWLAGGLSSDGIVYLFAESPGAAEETGDLERALAKQQIPYRVL